VVDIDLQYREIGFFIPPDELGFVGLLVGESNLDVVGILNHVVVGQDVAVVADDESRTEALDRPGGAGPAMVAVELAAEEAAEELVERIAAPVAGNIEAAGRGMFFGVDVDDRRGQFLDQWSEGRRRCRRPEIERGCEDEQQAEKQNKTGVTGLALEVLRKDHD